MPIWLTNIFALSQWLYHIVVFIMTTCVGASVHFSRSFEMADKSLHKVIDADKESEYGYVFGVSGPGKFLRVCGRPDALTCC